jgi:hypothetical protein
MLSGPAFAMMLDQARLSGGFEGAWRTALRLLSSGEPMRAAALGRALIFGR